MAVLIVLLSVLAIASCNDLHTGFPDTRQRLIFEQKYDYNPSIYTRSETVVISTSGNEIISQIDVTDMRENKDGLASVVNGGVGQRSVTIELKGPAVFRGMTFMVRVYAVDSDSFYNGNRNGNLRLGDYNGYPVKTGSYAYEQRQAYNDNQRSVKQ